MPAPGQHAVAKQPRLAALISSVSTLSQKTLAQKGEAHVADAVARGVVDALLRRPVFGRVRLRLGRGQAWRRGATSPLDEGGRSISSWIALRSATWSGTWQVRIEHRLVGTPTSGCATGCKSFDQLGGAERRADDAHRTNDRRWSATISWPRRRSCSRPMPRRPRRSRRPGLVSVAELGECAEHQMQLATAERIDGGATARDADRRRRDRAAWRRLPTSVGSEAAASPITPDRRPPERPERRRETGAAAPGGEMAVSSGNSARSSSGTYAANARPDKAGPARLGRNVRRRAEWPRPRRSAFPRRRRD